MYTGTDIVARRACADIAGYGPVGPDGLIRDVCGAVQDTECVIIAE